MSQAIVVTGQLPALHSPIPDSSFSVELSRLEVGLSADFNHMHGDQDDLRAGKGRVAAEAAEASAVQRKPRSRVTEGRVGQGI